MGAPFSALAALPADTAPAASQLVQGIVIDTDAAGLLAVQGSGRLWRAQRAASCLLVPETGDRVLLADVAPGQPGYVLAVLLRASAAGASLALPGDSRIVAPGSLSIEAEHDAALHGGRSLSLRGPALAVTARQAELQLHELDYLGQSARIGVGSLRLIGRLCETVMDRVTQVARHVFRRTEEDEQVRAGRLDLQAERSVRVHAGQTIVSGKALVKIDADQIHMG